MSSPKRRNDVALPEPVRRRIRRRRIGVAALQTAALFFVSAVPWAFGKQAEFALVFISFASVRMCLGFRKSLHFKDESLCVICASALFLALSLLTPDSGVSIILSLCYGSGCAIAFRLYWELRDLILYRKASKNDRYAMAYCALKGNTDPKHIYGIMRMRGYGKDDIAMFQEYMDGVKVSGIANDFHFTKIWVEQKLTAMVDSLYENR